MKTIKLTDNELYMTNDALEVRIDEIEEIIDSYNKKDQKEFKKEIKLCKQVIGKLMTNQNEKPMGKKLARDKVISITDKGDLVGVYWKGTDGIEILFECSPEKADKIIEIFNKN